VERSSPRPRKRTPWLRSTSRRALHAWTDGSFRTSAGLDWVVTADGGGAGNIVAKGNKYLGIRQMAFNAEITGIEEATCGSSPLANGTP